MRVARAADLSAHARAGHILIPLHKWDSVDDGRQTAIRTGTPEELSGAVDDVRVRGKSPLHPNWPTRAYTRDELRAAVDAGHNLGVRLRAQDVVIDYDPRNDPDGSGWAALEVDLGAEFLRSCPTVETGGGGRHLYTRRSIGGPIHGHLDDYGPGVEFKTLGTQVVAAGSKHPSGNYYEWDDFAPPPEETPELPIDLLARLEKPARVGSVAPGDLSPEDLARMLAALDPTDFQDYERWLHVGMASYHATNGLGREEFVEWSTSDPAYGDAGDEIREKWDSFAASPGGPARTVRTLVRLLKDRGVDLAWYELRGFPELPPLAEKPPEEAKFIGPQAPLERLSQRFAVVPEGSGTYVYRIRPGEVPQRMRVGAFHDLLANVFYENDEGNRVPLSKAWMASNRRRTYKGVEFAPEGGQPEYLNTWTGWGVEPDPDARWNYLYELIHEIICGGNDDWSRWLLDWCAMMVQRPSEPVDVAVCLRGSKGTGKSTLGRVLKEMAGNHGFALSHGLARQFNAHLRETVFLLADEAFFAGDKTAESQLKSMITEPEIMYEPKGVDSYMARNCLHILMCSNEAWVAPATMDERRFAVFDVEERRSREWWNLMHEQRLSGEMARGFLAHLMEREISQHPREDIPATGALARQKLESLGPLDLAWFQILQSGRLPAELPEEGGEPVYWCDAPVSVSADALRSIFARQDKRPGAERRLTTELGARLRVLIPGLKKRRARRSGDRAYVYDVPALDDCRAHFDRLIGHPMEWDS